MPFVSGEVPTATAGHAGHTAGGQVSYGGAYVHRAAVGNRRATRSALIAAGLIGAAFLGLVSLVIILGQTGPAGLVVGFVTAVLPLPIYLAIALRVDRYEPEPIRMLAAAFLWGATASVVIAFFVDIVLSPIASVLGEGGAEVFGTVIQAPVVEEVAKASVLFGIFFFRRNEFNGVLDGVVYAAMVGLGFAFTENILYYGRFVAEGALGELFLLRGIQSPFLHPMFTAMTGIGLGLAVASRQLAVKVAAPLGGLALAILLHGLWNGSAVFGALDYLYWPFFIPIFAGIVAVGIVVGRRELQLVGTYLRHDVSTGLLPGHELGTLASAGERRRAVAAAGRFGPAAKKARRRFHRAATELALHRHKVATGTYAGASADEDDLAYQHELHSLQLQFAGAGGQASGQPARTAQPIAPAQPGPAQPAASSAQPAPGWHPDPYGEARLRWWDGSRWSEHSSP